MLSRSRRRKPLKIGISPRIFHPDPNASGLSTKTLMYLEQSAAHWVMSRDVMVFMIPTIASDGILARSSIRLSDYAEHLDGLVLQGGADMNPASYGEEPLKPEWSGDKRRDDFEIELLMEFVEAGKPVLGICRGCQLINVAFGGSLYQDISTLHEGAIKHFDESSYDRHKHDIRIEPGGRLARLYPNMETLNVNSIHHQAIRSLGRNIKVEAWSIPDNLPEAIRADTDGYVMGLQWHPEFHRIDDPDLMDCSPILEDFLAAARKRA